MIELAALWKGVSKKDGSTYLKGSLNRNTDILIIANKFKRTDKDPDYKILIVKNDPDYAAKRQANATQAAQVQRTIQNIEQVASQPTLPTYEEAVGSKFPTQTKLFPQDSTNEEDVPF